MINRTHYQHSLRFQAQTSGIEGKKERKTKLTHLQVPSQAQFSFRNAQIDFVTHHPLHGKLV
ncbi:unnamed protein product [Tuber melanosporum]|uniref:(Perigord truffle) hypothetical protein n=1 Tax=Tuber melanosporum (strain Mel28) TaxID=656061 RepID=D5GK22_TUBMM|nr:uncharacterized protein GSTUM_00009329001 [Tuber melanosporum]CAZ84865.1 unnamed protein product [Tuber melanosporum]